MATMLNKRCRDCKTAQAAKVQWLEDESAALREWDLIHESTTEGEDEPADIPVVRSPTPPVICPSGLPNRRRRLPQCYCDDLPPIPNSAPALQHELMVDDGPIKPDIPRAAGETKYVTTEPDSYGLYRSYPNHFPTYNSDNLTSISHVSDSPHFIHTADQTGARPWWSGFGSSATLVKDNFFIPFLNSTIFRLMCWFYSGSNIKSLAELDRLVNDVILAEDFDSAHLTGFRAVKEVDHLDNYQGDPADIHSSFLGKDGWIEMSVKIRLPADGVQHASETSAPEFEVPGLFYHRLLEVIKSAFHEASAERFHLTPFKMFF
ncbi:uncharacterized protein BJ212DRAFT_1483803 [Suillus subaureus]|uniref:Uncharacterized protein n=1 Tax=Suillus subaureus TaxID=48587 RepID=A0A9P7E4L4_9AGAM|nr:uncharacterized protein BJ212DRAFT_1483803 [Suillus subaureus]KAG1811132.1 hypothetical protein BJ212DRAFT_1483803 [Suillus subaureus]